MVKISQGTLGAYRTPKPNAQVHAFLGHLEVPIRHCTWPRYNLTFTKCKNYFNNNNKTKWISL